MEDFYLEDSNEFEDWSAARREAYRRKALESLGTLTEVFIQKGAYKGAHSYAEKQLKIDPLRESAFRQLMELLSKSGHRAEALQAYQRCVRTLDLQLGSQPSQETTALYELISGEDIHLSMPKPREGSIRGYEIREYLGGGKAFMVYRAFQPVINRDVAVKVILPKFANHPDFIRQFEVSAQLAARLEHPYIVPLYDFWRDPSGAYLVMRWMKRGSLMSDLAHGPWTPESAVPLVEQISSGLALAHRQGVVHCDIRAGNILLDEEKNGYLADFGVAILTGPLGTKLSQNLYPGDFNAAQSLGYSPPEITAGSQASPQTDIYCLGVMLYEVLSGTPPFPGVAGDALTEKHSTEPLPLLKHKIPGLPGSIDDVIQRSTEKDPIHRFPDTLSMAGAFRKAVSPGERAAQKIQILAEDIRNPYKGLRPFEEADRGDFYGRDELISRLVSRLAARVQVPSAMTRFLAVVGPSGSGKSSVVKAGLMPKIRSGCIPGSQEWFVVDMTPGAHPLEEMESALLQVATQTPVDLLDVLRKDERGLVRALKRIQPESYTHVLLVIDQFEELFALVETRSEQDHFMDLLVEAINDPKGYLRLVITLRADFYDRPLQHPEFGKLMRNCTEVVLPMSAAELEGAICRPVEQVGVSIEPTLVGRVIQEIGDQPGGLPLLQYALTELFELSQGTTLTLEDYEASGGVLGALGRRAEEIYERLTDEEQAASRELFLRLITLGEGTEDVRRRTLVAELITLTGFGSEMGALLDKFGRFRLLTFDHDPNTRSPTVEVAHEALLREWGRLRNWLDESRDDIRFQRLLHAAADEWINSVEDSSFLLRGSRLDTFLDWAGSNKVVLTDKESSYLQASESARSARQEAEAERQAKEAALEGRSRKFLRMLVAVLAVAALIALVLSGVAFNQRGIAQQNAATATYAQGQALLEAATAEAAQEDAQQQAAIALTAQAMEAAQRQAAEAAEAAAVQERALADEQRQIAIARELSASALNNLDVDPERSILLALEAVNATYKINGSIILEAENALHEAIQASHILLTLRGHQGPVAGVDYSPDGRYILSGSYDGTAKLWDPETGEEIRTFRGHADIVFEVQFSPNGKMAATAGYDNEARVWDVETGQTLLVFSGHRAPINGVVFSPDGTRIATASLDQTAKVWDVASGEEIFTLAGHTDQLWHVEFNPDGSSILTVSKDGLAILWDADTGKRLKTLYKHSDIISRAKFSQDGKRVILVGNYGLAKVLDVNTGEALLDLPNLKGMILWGQFSPDNTRIATSASGEHPGFHDSETGELLFNLAGHSTFVVGLDFNPAGSRLATGSFDGTVKVWDLSPGRELVSAAVTHIFENQQFAYHPDGTKVAVTGDDSQVHIIDSGTGEILYSFNPGAYYREIWDLAFSPDGKWIAVTGDNNTATIWDALTGEHILDLIGHTSYEYPGTGIILTGTNGVAFSPDGTRLATGGVDFTARIWDASTGEELLTLVGHQPGTPELPGDGVIDVAFNPDGTLLGTTGADGAAKIWDSITGQEKKTFSGSDTDLWGIKFSPDGKYLAVRDIGGISKVYEVSTGQELLTFSDTQTSRVSSLDISPDSTLMATCSASGIVKIWDLAASITAGTGIERVTISGHQGIGCEEVGFSPDGQNLTAIYIDGTLRIYILNTGKLINFARSRVTRSLTEAECIQYLHLDSCPEGQ
jgi:WD40 repeat protein/serine/threonine protein kinase